MRRAGDISHPLCSGMLMVWPSSSAAVPGVSLKPSCVGYPSSAPDPSSVPHTVLAKPCVAQPCWQKSRR